MICTLVYQFFVFIPTTVAFHNLNERQFSILIVTEFISDVKVNNVNVTISLLGCPSL